MRDISPMLIIHYQYNLSQTEKGQKPGQTPPPHVTATAFWLGSVDF